MRLCLRPLHGPTTFFIMRGRPAWLAVLGGLAPLLGDDVLPERRRRHVMSYDVCLGLQGRQRVRQRRSLSSSANELSDAVHPILVEVVSRTVAQKLTRHEQC